MLAGLCKIRDWTPTQFIACSFYSSRFLLFIFHVSFSFSISIQAYSLDTEGTDRKIGHGGGSEVFTWNLLVRKTAVAAD